MITFLRQENTEITPVYGAEVKVGERISNTVSKFGKLGNVASSLVVHGNM